MPKRNEPIAEDWISSGFKGLIVTVISIGIWVFNTNSNTISKSIEENSNSLRRSIEGLTEEVKNLRTDQIKTNERVQAIEVQRAMAMPGYEKVQGDMQEIKQKVIQMDTKMQTMAEFMAGFPRKKNP